MRSFKSIPRILKINRIEGYNVSFLFSNGESRIVDFKNYFTEVLNLTESDTGYVLMKDIEKFKRMRISGNSVSWEDVGIWSEDDDKNKVFYEYQIDPLMLYENSEIDPEESLKIGLLIKESRVEAGMTQEELAKK